HELLARAITPGPAASRYLASTGSPRTAPKRPRSALAQPRITPAAAASNGRPASVIASTAAVLAAVPAAGDNAHPARLEARRGPAARQVLADNACRRGLPYRRSRVLIQRRGSPASPPSLPRLISRLVVVSIMIRVLNRLDQPDQCQRHEIGVDYPP